MLPKIFNNVWGSSGDLGSTPDAAKKVLGWVRERVKYMRFNFLQNRVETKINAIIQNGLGHWYPQASDINAMITTGLWDESWGVVSDDVNVIDSGVATSEYRDLAVYFSSNSEPRLLVLDNALTKIEVWDPLTRTLLDTSDALTDDLPAAGATWECESMCTDGTYVYCTFSDTNAIPDVHRIQAWTISDWSVKPGWLAVSATGTALQGTGNSPNDTRESKVIIADSDTLAVVACWQAITADTDPAIQLFDIADGTAGLDGAGDAPIADTAYGLDAICSDGVNIYFGVKGVSGGHVCTATILDPTAGTGGAGYPVNVVNADMALTACGPELIANTVWPVGGVTAADTIMYTHTATDGTEDTLLVGQDSKAAPSCAADWFLQYPLDNVFDGTNLLIFGQTSVDRAVLVKLDIGRLHLDDVSIDRQLPDVAIASYVMTPDSAFPVAGAGNWTYQRCIFDGRDVWVVLDSRASQTHSGKLFRLPAASRRS